jgi:hypothetical protein
MKLAGLVTFLKKYKGPIMIFLVIMLAYNLNFRTVGANDSVPASLTPFSLLEYHTLTLDHFSAYYNMTVGSTYFFQPERGHILSEYPIVLPLVITPLYVLPYVIMQAAGCSMTLPNPGFLLSIAWMEKISASIIASLSVVFIYLSLRELTDKRISILCTLAYAIATNTWVISSQDLWQQGMTELLLSIIIFLILINERKSDVKNVMLLGVMSGLLIFNRPSDSILILPAIAYVLSLKNNSLLNYIIPAAIVSLPFIGYNIYYFGSTFGGYSNMSSGFVINGSVLTNFLGLLISPSRGLFVYTPIALFAVAGFFYVKKIPNDRIRVFLYASALAVFLEIIVYSLYSGWWAGWSYGPRFLTCILPLLIIFISLSLPKNIVLKAPRKKDAAVLSAFIVLLALSVCVQAIGAFCYNDNWDASPVSVDNSPARVWDIQDTQIIRSLDLGPAPMTLLDFSSDSIGDNDSIQLINFYNAELWGNISTQWTPNISYIVYGSPDDRRANLTFKAFSFYENRTMQVYLDDSLVHEQSIATIAEGGNLVAVPLDLHKGFNYIAIYSVEPGQSPQSVNNDTNDTRVLCFALQDLRVQ